LQTFIEYIVTVKEQPVGAGEVRIEWALFCAVDANSVGRSVEAPAAVEVGDASGTIRVQSASGRVGVVVVVRVGQQRRVEDFIAGILIGM